MDRRTFLRAAAGLAAAVPLVARTAAEARVVVVGGGFAGATAAKHVRLWSPHTQVTLIEPNHEFISCPLSNRVLAGALSLRDLSRSYERLSAVHGVQIVYDTVVDVDFIRQQVVTAKGARLPYERLVVAPGVEFLYDGIVGLDTAAARDRVPHAWKAGPQTVRLRSQLTAMKPGGVFAIHVPKAPYRCPPGPYERACMAAYYFKRANPRAKVLVLDANPDVTAKKDLFKDYWAANYKGLVEYVPNADLRAVDAVAGIVRLDLQGDIRADVINVIPPQAAGAIARRTGLANDGGRWCKVDFLTYESSAARNVHVIGDASVASPGLPKSGHMANQQAKVCAAAIAAAIAGEPVNEEPILSNTCYSFVGDRDVVHVAGVYGYDRVARAMVAVPGAGGLSAAPNAEEGYMALAWAFNILNDSLG